MMHVSKSDWPHRIPKLSDERHREMIGYSSTIRLSSDSSKLANVHIYDNRVSFEEDEVHYDQALVFLFRNGYRFALAAHIAGMDNGLDFSEDESYIQKIADKYTLRLSVK